MDDPQVLERMRGDWNQRAGEDAHYYVAFGRREQDAEEFFATGDDVMIQLRREFPRLAARHAALEIGCGPGRLMRPMAAHFEEVHGVDVSDEMIRLAGARLRGVINAHPHHGSGADLALFSDNRFDLVYSYAVFQHIPSREVVFAYLREAHRVLKPGGILRCQLNGLPPHAKRYDTWNGVRIAPEEVREFARESGFELLALEQIWTQYMWVTFRKPGEPEVATLPAAPAARIRTLTNALTGEAAVPASGPLAAVALWIENLPRQADLNTLEVTADGRDCRMVYVGEAAADGVSQVNAWLPEGMRTGLAPIEVKWRGRPLAPPAWLRIIPAGPAVPRVTTVTDGVNLLSGTRIVSRSVKVIMTDVMDARDFRASVDGRSAADIERFCCDPLMGRYEFNFVLSDSAAPGPHEVRVALGRREFPPVAIEVV